MERMKTKNVYRAAGDQHEMKCCSTSALKRRKCNAESSARAVAKQIEGITCCLPVRIVFVRQIEMKCIQFEEQNKFGIFLFFSLSCSENKAHILHVSLLDALGGIVFVGLQLFCMS